jgi:heat shock protein HslJ
VLLGIAVGLGATACDTAIPTATPGPTAYVGGTWTVVQVGEYRPEGPDAPRFQFRQDGSIQETTGCNNIYAKALIDGERIVLDQLAVTTAGCPTDLLRDTETALVAALEGAEEISGTKESGRLVITGRGSDIVLTQAAR